MSFESEDLKEKPKMANGKRKIDAIRDAALTIKVGDERDGKQVDLVAVKGGKLYGVSENAVHQIFLADDIDPQRTNANTPNGSQKILDQGANSEIVGRVFLTAAVLFKSQSFSKVSEQKRLLELSLELTQELLGAEKIKTGLRTAIAREFREMEQPEKRDFTIPSVVGLKEDVKAFAQRIEHALQMLFKLTEVFYPKRKKMYDGFADTVTEMFGEKSDFSIFARRLADFSRYVRNMRASIEHPRDTQALIVRDFFLNSDSKLNFPTVQIDHIDTPQEQMDLGRFLKQVLHAFLNNTELLFAFLVNAHIVEKDRDTHRVGFVHLSERRRDKNVRLSYFILLHGSWHKLN